MTDSDGDLQDRLLQSGDGSEVQSDREDRVRVEAEKWHGKCGTDEDFDDAFCTCWANACRAVGPCGDCYICTPNGKQS